MVSSNDFSLFALFTAGLAAVASAQQKADTSNPPNGNSLIKPAGEAVPCGKPYEIIWQPTKDTTSDKVTLWLCKGPSTNCVIQPNPIAVHADNNGKYSWTPSCEFASTGTTGYGIQLVVETAPRTGQYQYTPQFGISGDKTSSSSTGSSSSTTSSSSSESTTSMTSSSESSYPTYTASKNTTIATVTPTKIVGYSSPAPTATSSESATPSGNAGNIVRNGAGLAVGIVAAFFAL